MTARHPARTANPAPTPPRAEDTSPAAEAPAPARLAYSVDEAASLTGLSRDLLYDEMRRGHLGYLKVGRRRLITRQHLEQFLGIIPRQPSRTDVTERKAANDGP
jgi:excisionase family DNA binding protein